ncbi:MAG TPA: hypothetical protein VFH72_06290 [Candidatus Baltobacteraceae bacterium]|jgi:hypothetical protein|nr:hypothetical protein [Candidatus Baltobacteraceae bacterium]
MRTGSHRLFIALVLALLAIAPQVARANTDASPAPSAAASAPASGDPAIMAQAEAWLARLQSGHVDKAARSQLDSQVNTLLTPAVIQAVAAKFGPLGAPVSFTYVGKQAVKDNMAYVYRITFKSTTMNEVFVLDKNGKVSGIQFPPSK